MEIQNVIYDDNTDIFYNDKYLEILKIKDFVFKYDKKMYVKHEYLKEPIFEKRKIISLDTEKDKKIYLKDVKIKNALIREFSKLVTVNRYLKFENENERVICINYIIRKFTNQRLNNKNICVLYFATNFTSMGYQKVDNILIDPDSHTLFNHSKNNNIYSWINHDGKTKYKSHIRNNSTNNNYYLSNHDTHGDIMLGNNLKVFRERNSKIKFDFYRISFNVCYQEFNCNVENNIILIILDLIRTNANKRAQIVFNGRLTNNIINNLVRILSPYFKKVLVLHPKYLHLTTDDVNILFDDYRGYMDKYDVNNIKKLVSNKNITKMTLTKFIKKENSILENEINKFLEILYKYQKEKMKIYYKLIPFLYKEQYKTIKEIIEYNLKKKQIAFANEKSNTKYLKY